MRLATFLMVLLLVPVGHASASPFIGTLQYYKGPMQPVYPPLEALTYEQVPPPNPQAAAAFAAAQRFHRLTDAMPNPQLSLPRCAQHFGEQFQRFQASIDDALEHFVRAQGRYVTLMMGDARYAMSAAEQLGLLYESMETRYWSGNLPECVDAAGLRQYSTGFHSRAFEAMLFCDQVAMHFHHHETTCQVWLRDHDYTFDANPIELTGQQRYEHSGWARNGLSHIARTRSHDRP